MKPLPSREELNRIFICVDGTILNRVHRAANARAGEPAGALCGRYLMIWINGQRYYAHRISWAMVNGDPGDVEIDHKDRNKFNNDPNNLRIATRTQNILNTSTRSDNTSGHRGVYKSGSSWHAKVVLNGVQYSAGYFKDKDQARLAVESLRAKLHGEFAA